MPNHIKTVLCVTYKNEDDYKERDKEVEELKKQVSSIESKGEKEGSKFDFENIIPMPPEVIASFDQPGADPLWYSWSIDNWGTKWNAYEIESDGYDTWVFQTTWAHPTPIIESLSKKYPSLIFKVAYADEDIGSNLGAYQMENGKKILEYKPREGFEAEMFARALRH